MACGDGIGSAQSHAAHPAWESYPMFDEKLRRRPYNADGDRLAVEASAHLVVAGARPSEPVKPAVAASVRENGYLLVEMNSRQCRCSVKNSASKAELHRFCGAPTAPGSAHCRKHKAELSHPARERGQSDGRR
jgi:hypothetical protein